MSEFVEKLRKQRQREKLSKEMERDSFVPPYNPIGNALAQWGSGVRERVSHPLETMANYAQSFRDMPIEEKMQQFGPAQLGKMSGLIGNVRKISESDIARLMQEAEDYQRLYEVQRAYVPPQSNALRNLAVGSGALGAGGLSGYYGIGLVEP